MSEPEGNVTLEEKEVQPLFERLAILRSQEGEIPAPFLEPLEEDLDDSVFGESVLEVFGDNDDPAPAEIEPTAIPFAGCFDPNRYYEVFDLLRLKPGHRLDYVYEFLGNSGQPLLYTRRDERRIQIPYEFADRFPGWESRPLYLEGLSFEKSALGFFQFALFCIEAPKFYLYWHAGYYDLHLVYTRLHLQGILQEIARSEPIAESDRKILDNELRPRVRIRGDAAEVVALSFTKWGGFFTHTSQITWPNRLQSAGGEKLVAYHCGITF